MALLERGNLVFQSYNVLSALIFVVKKKTPV